MLCARWRAVCLCLAAFPVIVSLTGCKSEPQPAEKQDATTQAAAPNAAGAVEDVESTGPQYALKLPDLASRTGDWEELKKGGNLRLLVIYSKTGFFYDKGRARGLNADAANELETYLNKKLKTGARKFKVVIVPITPAELEKDLNQGYGDIIASAIVVTPEREKRVDFSIPIASDLKFVVVTEKNTPQVSSPEDLSGKEIYVAQS